jgi:hypothetical protein
MSFETSFGAGWQRGARRSASVILTVVTPATSNDLTTKQKVKAELGISDISEDANITTWITQASDVISAECRRKFGEETVNESFRLPYNFDGPLQLARKPVSAVASVTENGTLLTVTTDYEFDPATGLVTRLSGDTPICWPWGKVVVIYTGGYALIDALPFGIERACIQLVKHYRSGASRDPMLKAESTDIPGVISQRDEFWVGGIGGSGQLPTEVSSLIAPYRRILVV